VAPFFFFFFVSLLLFSNPLFSFCLGIRFRVLLADRLAEEDRWMGYPVPFFAFIDGTVTRRLILGE
jgi:hypothetical protein